jgi:hypothetical protein
VARIDQRRWAHTASVWDIRTGTRRTATKDPLDRHVQESSRSKVVTNSQKLDRIEQTHIACVKPMSQTPQTRQKSGYTSTFNDASANRSEIVLRSKSACSKCQCDIARNSSPSDKTLDLSVVPPRGSCPPVVTWALIN